MDKASFVRLAVGAEDGGDHFANGTGVLRVVGTFLNLFIIASRDSAFGHVVSLHDVGARDKRVAKFGC